MVFGRPIDDRACQVKGMFLKASTGGETSAQFVMAQWEGFRDSSKDRDPSRGVSGLGDVAGGGDQAQATALFDQTPGPQAGAPLHE